MSLNAIKQMEHYARYQEGVVSLSQGIPFVESDPAIRTEVINAILAGKVDSYSDPQGILELRQAISEQLRKEDMQYSPDEIIVTAGAIEGVTLTFLNLVTADRPEIIVPTPAYSAYFKAIETAKGKAVALPLDENNNWQLDIALLENQMSDRTAAILICNPNNPTGNIHSRQTLEAVCEVARRHGAVVILDEVYKNMLFDDAVQYTPCVDDRFRDTIIRIVSFSKDFALTGWRVGFMHTDKKRITALVGVHDTLVNCTPVVSQYAALAAIRHQDRILASNKQIYSKNRAIMLEYLEKLDDYFDYTIPEAAYFFFPHFKKPTSSVAFCYDLLKSEKVAVVPGSAFGPGGENHIRLCFGKNEEQIRRGMEGITRYLTQSETSNTLTRTPATVSA